MTAPEPEKADKRRNYLLGYLYFSAVLMITLVVVVVLLAFQNQAHIREQRQANFALCQQNNTTRTQDIAIWNEFLKGLPGLAPAERARVNRLIIVKDTPRDCAGLFSGN